MTVTEILSTVVDKAKAKIDAHAQEIATLIPRIEDAYRKTIDAEKQGFNQSLAANILFGQILADAKDKITKAGFKWTDWREENIPQIKQTKASLCMRLYKNQDRLLKPNVGTDDGKRISDGVATALADGKMSVRKAAALLTVRTRTDSRTNKRTDEGIGRAWLKSLAADELLNWLQKDHSAEWRKALWTGLGKEFRPV